MESIKAAVVRCLLMRTASWAPEHLPPAPPELQAQPERLVQQELLARPEQMARMELTELPVQQARQVWRVQPALLGRLARLAPWTSATATQLAGLKLCSV